MLYIEKWKVYSILLVILCGFAFAFPNVLDSKTLESIRQSLPFVPNETVNLGLDLRGGAHLLLEVQVDTVVDERMAGLLDQVRADLRKEKIGFTDLTLKDRHVSFKVTDAATEERARSVIKSIDKELDVDVQNGVFTVLMSASSIFEKKASAMDQSIEIVRRRIDETGTREPSIQRQGDNRILVQLPGFDDPERIKKLLGQTAKLSFRLVDEVASASLDSGSKAVPPGTEKMPFAEHEGRSLVVQKRVMVSGDTLVDARPSFQDGEAVVSFRFDSVGAKRFGDATRLNVNRIFAIVLDNKVISAPVIREPILGGSGVISGTFTTESAQDLALLLRAGALPAPIKVLEERTVGPGLGADSIRSGVLASVIGFALVVGITIVAYGLFGIFAVIALVLNVVMIIGALSLLQATLTLPGIAGIVLTIGTAVDANVLIFERIREEMRLGRGIKGSLDAGYRHALPSIIDANMTTLIAAILLFFFGSGPIKGFAVTLSIGIVTSIFSAIMVTRLIVLWWLKVKNPKEIPL